MLYATLRAVNAITLRWYYSRIDVEGRDRLPAEGPALLAVNHPNSLVDSMITAFVFRRRLTFTGRATLFTNPIRAAFLRWAGVVPLIRQKDIAVLGASSDTNRNVGSFDALIAALKRGGASMIHPEGITGDHTSLAPLKTGAARIALQARDAGVRGLKVVPVGLTFERKDAPRSRVFVQVGDPIDIDAWPTVPQEQAARDITAELDKRLRAVTLNFESADASDRDRSLAHLLARVFQGTEAVPEVWPPETAMANQVSITRRIDEARAHLAKATPSKRIRAEALLDRLAKFRDELGHHGLSLEDLEISLDVTEGAWFAVREVGIIGAAGPVALWGWLNHVIPFNLAQSLAVRRVESAAEPAMQTMLIGIGLVVAFYMVQGALVWAVFGAIVALAYLISLPVAADINFQIRARLTRALRRARTYLRFRRDPALQARLGAELAWLRAEALVVEELLARG
jgi:glycerol-3-phosphate O-acyltransferase/dihydroxyacetone phosphate acyltransferase